MKKGKNLTALVLAMEIATIVVLHAIKINQSERPPITAGKEVSRNIAIQAYTKLRSSLSLALLK